MDILSRLNSPLLDRLRDVPGVWVVGGAVRDVLLGREPQEIDVVVEGDAIAVARSLGGEPVVHERFGTARLDGMDLTSARRETYERPGALPTVELGATLQEDLARRDFTVNAMAVRLADGEFAEWPGAREDLAAQRLRVLHPRSFSDDPTRMLRGVRYAARLGFTLETPADPALLATVSGERTGAEIRLALREPLVKVLPLLDATGLGAAVFGEFRAEPALIARVLELCPPDARCEWAALAACLTPGSRTDGLGFTAAERRTLRAPLEVALVAAARGDEAAREWLERLRHVRTEVTGDELVAAGLSGPAVGAALKRAWEAAAAGGDREAQLRAALDS